MNIRTLQSHDALMNRRAVEYLREAGMQISRPMIAACKAGIYGAEKEKQVAMNEHNWGED